MGQCDNTLVNPTHRDTASSGQRIEGRVQRIGNYLKVDKHVLQIEDGLSRNLGKSGAKPKEFLTHKPSRCLNTIL
jgi:hypothetical protein